MNRHSSTDKLHQNEYGYVLTCTCCDELQLHFGNVMIQMPVRGLQNLSSVMVEMKDSREGKPEVGRYLIRTPQQNMYITATESEFDGLIELVETSLCMYEVNKLLFDSEQNQ